MTIYNWVVIYADECGDTQVEYFVYYDSAVKFFDLCYWRIGLVTMSLYQKKLKGNLG